MTVSVVDLPLDELIHCEAFARAIARAIHPVPEEGASGMACVTGKLVAPDLRKASPQTELLDAVGADIAGAFPLPALIERDEQLELELRGEALENGRGATERQIWRLTSNLQFPHKLTDTDRESLERILPDLPPLRYPLSDRSREVFTQAFREKARDWLWEPILVTDAYVERQRERQEQTVKYHLATLADECSSGGTAILDRARTRLRRLAPVSDAYLSREAAIDYLYRHGLRYRKAKASARKPIDSQRDAGTIPPPTRGVSIGQASAGVVRSGGNDACDSDESGPHRADPQRGSVSSVVAVTGESDHATKAPVALRGTVLRISEVSELTGISVSMLYEKMNRKSRYYDPTFPKKVSFGARTVGYLQADVDAWIQQRVSAAKD
ncbi:phage transcriptional regulator AlpA [Burkholderia pseudomallei]|nr:phage transcriptional regulator AlpA [Burkholderia pseudomallei]CAJ7003536.1 phage transcriptional regulator AlpA [Burkholderia pseudomallei]CAK0122962.1 phage transcriptional regulator AlpA [Burkholderia pseudomallei]